ncbi:MAG: nucleoside monophosphate kinase [Puniceicoccales bacterium]|jgi:adenylate kinase|nr:nucleoside monophosphate kinase [Puniceicoccales bacterium]
MSLFAAKTNTEHSSENESARNIFNAVWQALETEPGRGKLIFPKEIFWLNGAPGAGKGTHTAFILKQRGYTSQPVVVSDLLQTPEARKRIDAGLLVSDHEVLELLLRRLLDPELRDGIIVDGFPRTQVQAECLKLLHARLEALHATNSAKYPKPAFHILILFVDENESVARQTKRGRDAQEMNAQADKKEDLVEVRKTDIDPELARSRYRVFLNLTHEPLLSLRGVFYYHLINAHGTIEDVRQRIEEELVQ